MSFVEFAQKLFEARVAGAASAGERDVRAGAWAEFERLGLPTRKTETWRYSNLTPVIRTTWTAADTTPTTAAEPLIAKLKSRYAATYDLVFVIDGLFVLEHAVLSEELKPLVSAAQYTATATSVDGFTNLVNATSRRGARIAVPRGKHLARPILLVHISAAAGETWSSSAHEIELAEGAGAELAEIYMSLGDARSFAGEVTRVTLGAGARLEWLRAPEASPLGTYYASATVDLLAGAQLFVHTLASRAPWMRNALNVRLLGREAEAWIDGLTFARGDQHSDLNVLVDHQSPDTRSSQLFKAVLGDRARGVVNGKIYIAQDAQRVGSAQVNHALLLSRSAEADIKPELEIYADDVKANHGASIGRLDKDKLFYFLSRGLTMSEAKQMLARAFVSDVLMKIQSPRLCALADEHVNARLPEFMHEMEGEFDEQ